jgi:hypothetical protein
MMIINGKKINISPMRGPISYKGIDKLLYTIGNVDTFLESGVFLGEFTRKAAPKAKKYYAVDPWQWEGDWSKVKPITAEATYNLFLENVKGFSNIEVLRMTALEASKLFPDNSLDVVYIDGIHDYENVSNDIKYWLPKVTRYLCGHDYNKKSFPGCVQAIHEAFGKPDLTFVDHSWLIDLKKRRIK